MYTLQLGSNFIHTFAPTRVLKFANFIQSSSLAFVQFFEEVIFEDIAKKSI